MKKQLLCASLLLCGSTSALAEGITTVDETAFRAFCAEVTCGDAVKGRTGGSTIVPDPTKVLSTVQLSPYIGSRVIVTYQFRALNPAVSAGATGTALAASSASTSQARSSAASPAIGNGNGHDCGKNDGKGHDTHEDCTDGSPEGSWGEEGATYLFIVAKVDGTTGQSITETCGQSCPQEDYAEFERRTATAPAPTAAPAAAPVSTRAVNSLK